MVYLDHAATTPMLPEAVEVMTARLAEVGNPSSLHAAGRTARRFVEESRETVAAALGARPGEVVFTSGGTEADNLAVKGLYWHRRSADDARRRILLSGIEHHAVLDSALWLAEQQGAVLEWLPVDGEGIVSAEALRMAIAAGPDDVALVSVMWANNEVGAVQPIAELTAVAAEWGIPVHTDAVQAVGQLDVDFSRCGAAAMTVTGHKYGGPLGAGALLLARDVDVTPVLHGGGQERDVRSGTLDTPALAAFAAATQVAVKDTGERAERYAALRDDLVTRLLAAVPEALLNGPPVDSGRRLPGNAHFSFPGCEGDALLLLLDARDIECSTGSACSAGVARPSHVLTAMGHDEDRARSSLRFSLGWTTTPADVDALLDVIAPIVERAAAAGR